MSQKLDLKLKGLNINPNDMSEVPAGSLLVANNVVLDKESILESRRGFNSYGIEYVPGSKFNTDKIFNYKNKLLLHTTNGKMYYDSNDAGSWIAYSGGMSGPNSLIFNPSPYKMRSVEANKNLYLTSSKGIYKLDKIAYIPNTGDVPDLAGVSPGLDGSAISVGSSGFLDPDRAIAYRVVFGIRDNNDNLILGAPGSRIIYSNLSVNSVDIRLTFTIPAGITTKHFFQVYRSGQSASATTEPNDEMQLVFEQSLIDSIIVNKETSILDQTPEDLKGATLYISPSQEGIALSNYPPPFAYDMDVYKNSVFYANVVGKYNLNVNFISVGAQGFSYTNIGSCVADATGFILTMASTSNVKLGQILTPATGNNSFFPYGLASYDYANTYNYVTQIINSTQIMIARAVTPAMVITLIVRDYIRIRNLSGLDLDFLIAGDSNLHINQGIDQFKIESSFTPAENIALTARNFVNQINKTSVSIQAYYSSGYNDLPGKVFIESARLNSVFNYNSFYYNSNTGKNFVPNISSILTEAVAEERKNRVFFSKTSQPESVPLPYYLDIGSANYEIKRVIALRDAIFILKGDGIWKITGENSSNFSVTLLDNTSIIKAPESAVTFNNQIFCFSDQGIISISDSGVQIISRVIENELLRISSSNFPLFESLSFGISYESDRKYIFFTVSETTDLYPTQAFIYNSLTNSWTRWLMSNTCGVVSKKDNKLYLGKIINDEAINGKTRIICERKAFDKYDYADESFSINIISIDPTNKTLITVSGSNLSLITPGMTLRQQGVNSVDALILEKNGSVLTVDKIVDYQALLQGQVYVPIKVEVQFVPCTIDNPGILKQFRELALIFRDATFYKLDIGFTTNFSQNKSFTTVNPIGFGSWGTFPWGSVAWGGQQGGQQAIRTFIPLEKQRANWLNISIYNQQAFTALSLSGLSVIYNPMSERFK